MKKIAIILIICFVTFSGKAQDFFDAGLKAGINSSKISTHLSDYTPQTINNYSFGAFARLSLGRLYVQPEAYYNTKGGEEINKIDASITNKFDLNSIDVPALVGLKIVNQKAVNLRVMAGPVFSFLTNKSASGQLTEDNLKNSFLAWQYGVGVDVLFLTLDARMESYNRNFYEGISSKNGTFVISLGIKLF
ncbi:MAG TPA: porin family protein [Prolixibacteraceae bacterium]|nr:porin family protein [Prolixibacteraceae bacterium]